MLERSKSVDPEGRQIDIGRAIADQGSDMAASYRATRQAEMTVTESVEDIAMLG